jgi:hypothetical protein
LEGRLAALGTVSGEDVATLCGFRPQGSIDAMLEILLPRCAARERGQGAARGAKRDCRFESKESVSRRQLRHYASSAGPDCALSSIIRSTIKDN